MKREKRKIDNLILTDENYIFAGDLEIEGKVVIKNGCQLIVSGKLTIISDYVMIFGDISAYEISIKNCNNDESIFFISGDIYAFKSLICKTVIYSEEDIIVHGQLTAYEDINCLNLFIDGNNFSHSISAKEKIKILGNSYSCNLNARDIFIGGYADFHNHSLNASRSACIKGKINLCSSITVGK